jgi:hypothetical protein
MSFDTTASTVDYRNQFCGGVELSPSRRNLPRLVVTSPAQAPGRAASVGKAVLRLLIYAVYVTALTGMVVSARNVYVQGVTAMHANR